MSMRSTLRRFLLSRSSIVANTFSVKQKSLPEKYVLLETAFMSRMYTTSQLSTHGSRLRGSSISYGIASPVLRSLDNLAFARYHPRFRFNAFKSSGFRNYSGGSDIFNPNGVLWTLIGTNVVVYAMWQNLNFRFMEKHFMVSVDSVLRGRLHTMLTSAFSQKDAGHLLTNMIGLYFFGSEIGRIFGGKYLLTLYLVGAVGGSVGHMIYFAYVYPWLKKNQRYFYNVRYSPPALGSSGSVTSIMLLHILLYPTQMIYFQMFIPMPAALVGAIIIGRDLWLAKQGDSDVSVGGHLGGALVALLAFIRIRF